MLVEDEYIDDFFFFNSKECGLIDYYVAVNPVGGGAFGAFFLV